MNKEILRSSIFRHLDGIVTAPVAVSLNKKGIIDHILEKETINLSDLTEQFKANEGYLNVALHTLGSQGFITYNTDNNKNTVSVTANSNTLLLKKFSFLYDKIIPFLKKSTDIRNQILETSFIEEFSLLAAAMKSNFDLEISDNPEEKAIQEQILKHIEGCIIGPVIVYLGMTGMFHKYFMETSFQAAEFHKKAENFEVILDFLTHLGWFRKNGSNYKFTETGVYYAKRAASYGVTVSYLPMLNRLDELLFGDAHKIREIAEGDDEIHVDRAMNVWGSGGAHSNYFKVANDFIIQVFNQPIHLQPKGILDMGCGNGAFIQHIFETIERQTLRGKMLEEHPLFLVGADYCFATKDAALALTEINLGIGPFVIGPYVERKIGKSQFSAMAIDAEFRSAEWAEQHNIYHSVSENIAEMDAKLDDFLQKLSTRSDEALALIKKVSWEGTDYFNMLMPDRIHMSASLILEDSAKKNIEAIKERLRAK